MANERVRRGAAALLLFLSTAAIAPGEEHALLRPVPESVAVAISAPVDNGELVVTYRDDDGRHRERVFGRLFRLEYDIFEATRDEIVDHFKSEVERLDGEIYRETDNQLTFRFVREDRGETWGLLWATDGNYTLEIVDEPAPAVPEPAAETSSAVKKGPAPQRVLGVVRLAPGATGLSPGAGAVLDRVAARLLDEPELRVAIRGRRGLGLVVDALLLYGIESERLVVEDEGEREGERPRDGSVEIVVSP